MISPALVKPVQIAASVSRYMTHSTHRLDALKILARVGALAAVCDQRKSLWDVLPRLRRRALCAVFNHGF